MTAPKYEQALQVMEDLDANDPNTSASDAVSTLGRVLIELASDFIATGGMAETVVVSSITAAVAVTDNGGSLTVDGTVAVSGSVPVTDNNGSLTVDDGGASITVDGAVAIAGTVAVTDNSGSLTIDDGGASITVDGTVSIAGPVPVTDNGGSLTVDGTVAVSGAVAVTDNAGSLTVDDGGGSLTVDGTVAVSSVGGTVAVTDNSGSLTVDDGGASITVDGTVAVSSVGGTVAVTDNGGSLTVDGTVAITGVVAVTDNGGSLTVDGTVAVSSVGGTVAVTDNAGSLTVDDGSGSLTVDGTVAVSSVGGTVAVTDNGGSLTVDDGSGSLTVDGTVAVSSVGGTVAVTDNSGSLTVDDGGASITVDGTLAVTDGGGSLTVDGTVAVSSLPSLPTGANTIGKLAANSGVDIGDVDARTGKTDILSTTPLTAFESYASDWLDTDGYGTLVLHIKSDQVGEISVSWSAHPDGSDLRSDPTLDYGVVPSQAANRVAAYADDILTLKFAVRARYVQVTYSNGATNQFSFALTARLLPEMQQDAAPETTEVGFDATAAEVVTVGSWYTDGFASVSLSIVAGVAGAVNGVVLTWWSDTDPTQRVDTVQKYSYTGANVGNWYTIPVKIHGNGFTLRYTNGGSPLTGAAVVVRRLKTAPAQPVTDGQSLTSFEAPIATLAAGSDGSAARILKTLTDGKLTVDVGSWLASVAPTVGQKTSAASIPVVLPSDQTVDVALDQIVTVGGLGVDLETAELSIVQVVNRNAAAVDDRRVADRLDKLIEIGTEVRDLLVILVARL